MSDSSPNRAASGANPFPRENERRYRRERINSGLLKAATYFVLLCAAVIFGKIAWEGSQTLFTAHAPFIDFDFLLKSPQTLHVFEYGGEEMRMDEDDFRAWLAAEGIDPPQTEAYPLVGGGILPCILGTILLVAGSISVALLLGVPAAIYLSEYSRNSGLVRLIRLSIVNLAGVPSIVFGLFGYALFVVMGPVFTDSPETSSALVLPLFGTFLSFQGWGVSLLSGAFTLSFMVLPIVIASSEQALRAVPQGFREGALALGATQWQSIRSNVLPYALPGILTSSVLSIARAAGETAPIMFTAAVGSRDIPLWKVESLAEFFTQGVMALPYHVYTVSAKIEQNAYTERMQFGSALVFLLLVAALSAVALWVRERSRRRYQW